MLINLAVRIGKTCFSRLGKKDAFDLEIRTMEEEDGWTWTWSPWQAGNR
jgi:hypothetical protein